MITKRDAIDRAWRDFIFRRAEEVLGKNCLDDDRQEELFGWMDDRWDDLVRRFTEEWPDPEEVPCGWLFDSPLVRMGGPAWFLIDLWTGETIWYAGEQYAHRHDLRIEEALRLYIEHLPEHRRSEAQERMHLMPYEPVHFYPPYLDFPTDIYEESKPRVFEVRLDPAFFAAKQLPLPDVVLVEAASRSMNLQEMRQQREWVFPEREEVLGAIQRIRRREEDNAIWDKYRLVIPALNAPSPDHQFRFVEVRLKYPGISPAQKEMVEAENLDRFGISLAFEVTAEE